MITTAAGPLSALRVSESQHVHVTADGQPFSGLGDTGRELFHWLNREDAGIMSIIARGMRSQSFRPRRSLNSTASVGPRSLAANRTAGHDFAVTKAKASSVHLPVRAGHPSPFIGARQRRESNYESNRRWIAGSGDATLPPLFPCPPSRE